MRRDEIADVDFPGNVMMLGGVALTAFGAYRLWFGDTTCAGLGQAGNCLGTVMPAVGGAAGVRVGALQLLPVDARVRGEVAAGAGPADAATRAERRRRRCRCRDRASRIRSPIRGLEAQAGGWFPPTEAANHDPDIDEPCAAPDHRAGGERTPPRRGERDPARARDRDGGGPAAPDDEGPRAAAPRGAGAATTGSATSSGARLRRRSKRSRARPPGFRPTRARSRARRPPWPTRSPPATDGSRTAGWHLSHNPRSDRRGRRSEDRFASVIGVALFRSGPRSRSVIVWRFLICGGRCDDEVT